jgi:Pyridoxal-dependent decarboxylase, pyridoxal binding domain
VALLEVLAAAGACFDCASEAEIAAVQGCGVSADRIIFANACKRPSDIRCKLLCKCHVNCLHSPCIDDEQSRAIDVQQWPFMMMSFTCAELPRHQACT